MISTGEMYGNVQEERDEFVVLQEQLAKRAKEQKVAQEAVATEKAEEIVIPDFPKE